MVEISKEVIDVIKYATTMEINGRSFYEHVAELTHNNHGKDVFKKLADDEMTHIKTFGEIFTSVLGSDEWENYVNREEENKHTVLDELKARVEKKGKEEHANDLEALRIGMELERNTVKEYKKWSGETRDPKVQTIFKQIIKEEQYHYDLLQAEYDSLTNSGFWFDMAEFRMNSKF